MLFWMRKVRELGRVCSEDLEAKLPQLVLCEGQPHVKNFEHLQFHLSNIPATEGAGDVHPVTVVVGRIEGILKRQARIMKGRSAITDNRERTRNVANL